ncbi:ATPase family associated with various cellular activities (AAA) [Treponema bryantii]|uniref:ATPase family associated with various cellular activities (AAA) n=1 Tax=Treponema bryantii TaxID=163 RepID=A0A1H9JIV6_9SPIR|nr:AAA family ATPase [Treponema bryantii]SEQ86495.1 ATPase family associated with various cellular activities (AAA) [Treponema bryantii]
MHEVTVRVKIPFLWGKTVFKKTNWSQINLIVGPNGSGKTLLAQNIAQQFEQAGYSVRFLKSDRNYSEQIVVLKNNEKIRAKIEKVLSSMFGKSITFIEDIDGTLIPIVENKAWNVEYMLEDAECHGLREIISLLVNLYDTTGDDCLFIDEPELHLHPQFQTFFMNEIRKEVSHSSRRMFFLISHSPFYIDLRTPEELTGVVVCHVNKAPTSIEELNDDDDSLFRRFLPRFNTYHKQFFFSDNQIFVEGYTDQQMFTYLLTFIENEYSAAGTGIIDVGGKDELGVFCKVCSLLGTNGRIITDLDSLFSGKLRDVANEDERVIGWLEKQKERQADFYNTIFSKKEVEQEITLSKLIFRLERYLIRISQELHKYFEVNKIPAKMQPLMEKLAQLREKHENAESVDTYKTVLLQGINNVGDEIAECLPQEVAETIPLIKNLAAFILAAAEAARIYILPKGCIEHYYTRTSIQYMPVSAKDRLFRNELEFIQDAHRKSVRKNYSELIELLEKAASKN